MLSAAASMNALPLRKEDGWMNDGVGLPMAKEILICESDGRGVCSV